MANQKLMGLDKYGATFRLLRQLFPEYEMYSDYDLGRKMFERGCEATLSEKREDLVSLKENGGSTTWSRDYPHPNLPFAVVLALNKYGGRHE